MLTENVRQVKAQQTLHYLDVLARLENVTTVSSVEISERIEKACNFFEKIVLED